MADIIILAAFTIFLVLRLRSTLGKKTGFNNFESYKPTAKQMRDANVIAPITKKPENKDAKSKKPKPDKLAEQCSETLQKKITQIKEIDSSFTVDNFIKGARTAFDMVFDAFNKGDKETLKMLLSDKIYKSMQKDIKAPAKNAEEILQNNLIGIEKAEITKIALKDSVAKISVDFISEQIEAMQDKHGNFIDGQEAQTEQMEDIWTFERDLKSQDPTWKITAM